MLADAIEKCKNSGFKGYQLCLAHYLSTPAVSWYAILNMEKVELELIWDSDMYFSLQKCIRSAVSYISKR